RRAARRRAPGADEPVHLVPDPRVAGALPGRLPHLRAVAGPGRHHPERGRVLTRPGIPRAMPDTPAVRAHGVRKSYGGVAALTARQNLAALAGLRGDGVDGVGDALAHVGLTDVADDRVRGFSLGLRQRLGLAAALLTRPRLLVLDEPANGLDPAGSRHVHRVLTRLAADGTAVVLSSHRMDDVEALCAEVTILNTGRVVF